MSQSIPNAAKAFLSLHAAPQVIPDDLFTAAREPVRRRLADVLSQMIELVEAEHGECAFPDINALVVDAARLTKKLGVLFQHPPVQIISYTRGESEPFDTYGPKTRMIMAELFERENPGVVCAIGYRLHGPRTGELFEGFPVAAFDESGRDIYASFPKTEERSLFVAACKLWIRWLEGTPGSFSAPTSVAGDKKNRPSRSVSKRTEMLGRAAKVVEAIQKEIEHDTGRTLTGILRIEGLVDINGFQKSKAFTEARAHWETLDSRRKGIVLQPMEPPIGDAAKVVGIIEKARRLGDHEPPDPIDVADELKISHQDAQDCIDEAIYWLQYKGSCEKKTPQKTPSKLP